MLAKVLAGRLVFRPIPGSRSAYFEGGAAFESLFPRPSDALVGIVDGVGSPVSRGLEPLLPED